MKTKILFLIAISLGSNIYSRDNVEPSIVITKNDTTVCKKVALNSNGIVMKMFDGTSVNVSNDNVLTFTSQGKTFERRELYINNKATGKFVLMELLGQKNGLRLYRYDFSKASQDIIALKNSEKVENHTTLLIYKDENFYVQVSKANASTILDMFNLNELFYEV